MVPSFQKLDDTLACMKNNYNADVFTSYSDKANLTITHVVNMETLLSMQH